MKLLRAAIATFTSTTLPGVRVPKKKIVLRQGHVDLKRSSVVHSLAGEWEGSAEQLQSRELLFLCWFGGGPRASSETALDVYRLEEDSSLYVVRSDFGEEGTFLIAAADQIADDVDTAVLKELLMTNGERFGLEIFGGPPDEGRCVLTPDELAPILVEALNRARTKQDLEGWDEVFYPGDGSLDSEGELDREAEPDDVKLAREYLGRIL
jgi:hypothetical protein